MAPQLTNSKPIITIVLLAAVLLAGCAGPALPIVPTVPQSAPTIPPADLGEVLKQVAALPGWQPQEVARFFVHDSLYELMDGQSDSYFVYGFEQAGVQRFQPPDVVGGTVIVAVFQLDSPASAYGLFTQSGDGEPIAVGNEGAGTPGQRIVFWQSSFFAQVTALKPISEDALLQAAEKVSSALPSGGAVPALLTSLPKNGQEVRYFHQELSIQDSVWLGGQNILDLGMDTGGFVARYDLSDAPVWLLLVEYPDAARAASALKALNAASDLNLVASKVTGNRLGAVFGAANQSESKTLLDQAMANP